MSIFTNLGNTIRSLMDKYVTNALIGFNAHWLFGYAVIFTWFSWKAVLFWTVIFGIKEFYIDKHFEHNQTFMINLKDWLAYMLGIGLGIMMHFVR